MYVISFCSHINIQVDIISILLMGKLSTWEIE